MKELPENKSEEIRLNVDYLICRFMKSKRAFKINQNQDGTWFTIKEVKEKGLYPQYQIHIRFDGKDEWFNENETIDLDVYIKKEELDKLKQLKGGQSKNAKEKTN